MLDIYLCFLDCVEFSLATFAVKYISCGRVCSQQYLGRLHASLTNAVLIMSSFKVCFICRKTPYAI